MIPTTTKIPSTIDVLRSEAMFHVSGFSEGLTLSVAIDMVTKSTKNSKRTTWKASITNSPVKRKAKTTKTTI